MRVPLIGLALMLAVGPDGGPIARHTEDGRDVIRPSWSPDGRSLAFAREDQGGAAIWQYVMPVDPPGPPRRLTERTDPEYHGVFSPDGRRVLLTIVPRSGNQGNCDIAVVDLESGGLTVLVDDMGRLSHQDWPSWSPDGERFAFSSTHEGHQEIYTASADGSDLVRLTQSPGIDARPCWSPRGDRIVFATDRWGGGFELASVRPDGTGLARLTDSPGLDDYPSLSPDGRHLAFVSNRDRQFEIYVLDLDSEGPPINVSRHPGLDTMPSWTPDGRGVTFVSNRDGGMDIYTVDVSSPLDLHPDPDAP